MIGTTAVSKSALSKNDRLNLRKHEIYDNTYYIPNTQIRLLEISMNSSLSF